MAEHPKAETAPTANVQSELNGLRGAALSASQAPNAHITLRPSLILPIVGESQRISYTLGHASGRTTFPRVNREENHPGYLKGSYRIDATIPTFHSSTHNGTPEVSPSGRCACACYLFRLDMKAMSSRAKCRVLFMSAKLNGVCDSRGCAVACERTAGQFRKASFIRVGRGILGNRIGLQCPVDVHRL